MESEAQQAQALQSRLKQRFRVRMIVGGFFAGEQGACCSNLTAPATQALVHRLKLRHATLLYHDYPLPALLCDLGEDWRAQELGRPWQVLGAQDEKGVLRGTLRHYFSQNCDQTQIAAQLHIQYSALPATAYRSDYLTKNQSVNRLAAAVYRHAEARLSCANPQFRRREKRRFFVVSSQAYGRRPG